MRAMIQCMHENNYQNLAFPSKEKELQILCDSLGVANTTKTEIKIGSVHIRIFARKEWIRKRRDSFFCRDAFDCDIRLLLLGHSMDAF